MQLSPLIVSVLAPTRATLSLTIFLHSSRGHCDLLGAIVRLEHVWINILWYVSELQSRTMRSYALAAWINISEHALNTVYALIEITLTSVAPSAWLHLPLCVFMLACYLGVAYITEATQGFYSMLFFPSIPFNLPPVLWGCSR